MKPLALILTAALLLGCDRQSASNSPKPTASVAGAATQPAAAHVAALPPPVYPTRPPAVMTLDGHQVPFPAARLAVLGKSRGGLTIRLCSDDPPTSIDPGYAGNSFVFDMTLPVDNVAAIPTAVWDYKSHSSTPPDDATGIFLHGYHDQLLPDNVHVTFQKDGDQLLAYVSGSFLHSDTRSPIAPPDRVQVNTCLRVAVGEK